MSDQAIYPLIMAGGSGTRLWPASRAARPKHLLPLFGDRSLLQMTSDRLRGLAPAANQFVVTSAAYRDAIVEQLPNLPTDQIVAEPEGLGTAAAVGLGAALVKARDPHGIVVCCPADHLIEPLDGFRKTALRASSAAAAGHVVVIGVPPASPDPAYGYIEPGAEMADAPGVYRVAAFREKPDKPTAAAYVDQGFLWNAGIFIWSVDTIWREYGTHLPRLRADMDDLARAAQVGALAKVLPAVWGRIEDRTTVDYGVLEKSERVACVRADFSWSDVGSWDALAAALADGADGNHLEGDVVAVGTEGSLVLARGGRLVAVAGIRDLVVVDTGDAVLVLPRSEAQSVRAIVEALKASGRGGLL